MIQHGVAPFLECSSRGDHRFSAFYAKVDGKSIEQIYQAAKVFPHHQTGLSWREAKGRQALNHAYVRFLYTRLWRQYIREHPELQEILKSATGLSDIFGKPGHACQATELWNIRKELLNVEIRIFVPRRPTLLQTMTEATRHVLERPELAGLDIDPAVDKITVVLMTRLRVKRRRRPK